MLNLIKFIERNSITIQNYTCIGIYMIHFNLQNKPSADQEPNMNGIPSQTLVVHHSKDLVLQFHHASYNMSTST